MQHPKCLAFLIIPSVVATLSAKEPLSKLDAILERGYLRVGTTDDFNPFTYFNPESKKFEGIDIDAAESMGQALGVEVRYVKTTWSTLVEGILEDRDDIAVGGITRTLKRQTLVGITDPYFKVGKCPLVRTEDQARLNNIQALNNASVRVGVNPGGTNEAFVRQYLTQATVTVVPDNLAIPGKVLSGEFDVMMTDNVEAMLFAARMPGLSAVNPDTPFTKEDFGYLLPRDDTTLLAWLNLWLHQARAKGHYNNRQATWISH